MTFNQFVKRWNNHHVDMDNFPKENPFQCVDLIKQYAHDVGYPVLLGDAIDWAKPREGYIWVKYKLGRKPNPEYIVVWNFGEYGHIGVVLSANVLGMKTFEQNSPIGSPCRKHTRTYYKVLGWQIPIPKWAIIASPTYLYDKPTNKSLKVRLMPKFEEFKVYGVVVGQQIQGNDKWYKTEKGHYVWTGKTN